MTNKEIRKKAFELYKKNFGAIFVMALIYAICQTVVTVVDTVMALSQSTSVMVPILSLILLAPISLGMLNGYWKITLGEILSKSHIFEWIGVLSLMWCSIKVQVYLTFRLLPWLLPIIFIGIPALYYLSFVGLILFYMLLALPLYKGIEYNGGMVECALNPKHQITPIFKDGCANMKPLVGRYIKLIFAYLPLLLLFSTPLIAYEVTSQAIDTLYWGLSLFNTFGMAFLISPLVSLSLIVLYNDQNPIKKEEPILSDDSFEETLNFDE